MGSRFLDARLFTPGHGGAVFPLFVLSVLSTPVFGVDALSLPKRGSGPIGLSVGLMLVRTSTQVYVWLGWAAYCASLALRYTSSPMVDNTAGYYGAAFLAANIPIAFLALKGVRSWRPMTNGAG